jgi:hypothetical protein
VFLSIDGHRTEEEKSLVDQSEAVAKQVLGQKLKFVHRSSVNLGCKGGVEAAISWFFSKVPFGVICEDDVLISDNCIKNINRVTNAYGGSLPPGVSHISFYRPPLIKEQNDDFWELSDTAFVWGWFTTAEKWHRHIEVWKDPDAIDRLKSVNLFSASIVATKRRYSELLSVFNGNTDTWDWNWQASMRLHNEKSLVPPRQLSKNIGSSAGAHASFNFWSVEKTQMKTADFGGIKPYSDVGFDRVFLRIYMRSKFRTVWNEIIFRIRYICSQI